MSSMVRARKTLHERGKGSKGRSKTCCFRLLGCSALANCWVVQLLLIAGTYSLVGRRGVLEKRGEARKILPSLGK